MTGPSQLCTFFVADLFLGVEAVRVQEVFRDRGLTPVPLAAPPVAGLINLRGLVVPALDLRRPLGRPERPAERPPLNVLVNTSDGPVSFLADADGDAVEAAAADFKPPPETLARVARP